MNTLVARRVVVKGACARGGLVQLWPSFVPGVKQTRRRVWLQRHADGWLVAVVPGWAAVYAGMGGGLDPV